MLRKIILIALAISVIFSGIAIAEDPDINELIQQLLKEQQEQTREQVEAVVEVLITLFILMILFYLIPCFVCAVAARRKGLTSVGFFLFALFFTPLMGFIAVIAMTPKIESIGVIELEQPIKE